MESKELDLYEPIVTKIASAFKVTSQSSIVYTLTLHYIPTDTYHKCTLKIYIYPDIASVRFDILDNRASNTHTICISSIFSHERRFFNSSNSVIKSNIRTTSDDSHCFHPSVPEGRGVMTDFLQILSTKIKYFYALLLKKRNPKYPPPRIFIIDQAHKEIDDEVYDLTYFQYRIMRGFSEPSIYQKYGYHFVDPNWEKFKEYLGTVRPKDIDVTGVRLSHKNMRTAMARLQKKLGELYDDTLPFSTLLKHISYEDDNNLQISELLFESLYSLKEDKGTIPSDSVPELQFIPESSEWISSEKKLLIVNVEEGAIFPHEATEGGGGASASGGARQTRRHRRNRKKTRVRRSKLDRGRSA